MHVARCVSFFVKLIQPQQHHPLLSATFVFAVDRHRKTYLPLLFLIGTSIAPSLWRGWKNAWQKHLVDQSWPMSQLWSPHLENCIKSAKTPTMQRMKQATCLLQERSNMFWMLVFPKLDYFEDVKAGFIDMITVGYQVLWQWNSVYIEVSTLHTVFFNWDNIR